MIYGSVCSGVVAQVDGWVHGGDLPRCLFDPLDFKSNHKEASPKLLTDGATAS